MDKCRTHYSLNSNGSVLTIGAATLADIYEPFERGTKMGIYYAAPILGPSLGPIIGGLLTKAFSWRAPFWLLAADIGVNVVVIVFCFRDTFRKERSLTYQRVLASRRRCAVSKQSSVVSDPAKELDNKSNGVAIVTSPASATVANPQAGIEITLSLKDVNPFSPLVLVLKRRNNVVTLFSSGMQKSLRVIRPKPTYLRLGLLFAFSFNITYTSSRTLGNHYNYDPLKIGFVLLSYGIGCMLGSVLGGRWSDQVVRRLTSANGGNYLPEACHPLLPSYRPTFEFSKGLIHDVY